MGNQAGRGACIIIPPSPFLMDERVFMSLGPLKVAAALEKNGYAVDVLDLSGEKNYLDKVVEYTTLYNVRLFGISATSPQMPAAREIALTIPKDRVVLGGPHVTLCNAARKKGSTRAARAMAQLTKDFDVLVCGDGEKSILAAFGEDPPLVIDADDRHSPYWMTDKDLDSTWPARHLIDVDSYHYRIDGIPALSLVAQLGCPFGCGFCAGRSSPMLRHIRMRSVLSIVDEMTHLYKTYGTRGFMFYDDELNVNKSMTGLMWQIARKQRELATSWRLRGFIKAELFTDEQAEVMHTAGFRWILVGFESGSDRILENINKRATKDDNTRCIDIARRHNLKVKALMSLGHPGESFETIQETMQWIRDVRPDDFDATVITPYPGSPYYDKAVEHINRSWVYTCKNGDRLYQDEVDYTKSADYYKGAPGNYVSHVWTDKLTKFELVQHRDNFERTLRVELDIPFNGSPPSRDYEHSMGQSLG